MLPKQKNNMLPFLVKVYYSKVKVYIWQFIAI